MNKKMPNKFIAREKPQAESKFVPFVNENFSNKKASEVIQERGVTTPNHERKDAK